MKIKKMSLKKQFGEGGYKKFLLKRAFDLEKGGWKYFKKGELGHKGVEKKRGGCDPQRNYKDALTRG